MVFIPSTSPLPQVLKSWEQIYTNHPELYQQLNLPIESLGATYAMTQELIWLDDNHFIVGRWDGSMSIFEFTQENNTGPIISMVVNTPASEGVQMITLLHKGAFATSNDNSSIIIWSCNGLDWDSLKSSHKLEYDESFGVANSGVSFKLNNDIYFIIGHSNGFVTSWKALQADLNFQMISTTNVRSPKPVNPWSLHNVRGISYIKDHAQNYPKPLVVTGSEDGDLCIISVDDGKIIHRKVYNSDAQRGINNIALRHNHLLVANCAVGSNDHNLWLYEIDVNNNDGIQFIAKANLQLDRQLAQVFNFDVIWSESDSDPYWFCATEEGLLWMGTLSPNETLSILGKHQITAKLGAAIAVTNHHNLAVSAYNIYEFKVQV